MTQKQQKEKKAKMQTWAPIKLEAYKNKWNIGQKKEKIELKNEGKYKAWGSKKSKGDGKECISSSALPETYNLNTSATTDTGACAAGESLAVHGLQKYWRVTQTSYAGRNEAAGAAKR